MKKRLFEFFRFCVSGLIAFCVDTGVMELMVHLGLSVLVARCISLLVALHVAFVLHGKFTYNNHTGYTIRRWLNFLGSNLLGALLNYLIFITILWLSPFSGFRARLLGIVTATSVSMFYNYWANRRFVFIAKGK